MRQKVVVLTTGGTIEMTSVSEAEGIKIQDSHILQETLPLLDQYAEIEMEHLFNLPSPHITPDEMEHIARRIEKYLSMEKVKGIVITHGTDTLEETAYFLHLVLPRTKPVVVTGAMRSHNELGADGPYNLVNAVRVAAHDQAGNRGTLVVFHDEIHSARTVTKSHTSNVAAFQSPGSGPLGMITKKKIIFHRETFDEKKLPLVVPSRQVALIKTASGMDGSMIEWALARKMGGIVIEALGQGNVPPAMLPGIRKALAHHIPVVLVSRCFDGFVQGTYGYEGGGKQLKEMGVIFSNGINGQKARIKLMLALELTSDRQRLEEIFQI
ncbi:MAG: asparaginase [Thermoactinomyces sp.]